jgi:type I restriction enzyme S subunit
MIDLPEDHLRTVSGILAAHVPGVEARVFGSRVAGNATDFSDLDIALLGRVGPEQLTAVKDAFAESDLPFMVDVVTWASISGEFRKLIEERYEVLQKPRP